MFIGNAFEDLHDELIDDSAVGEIVIDDADFFFEFGGKFENRAQEKDVFFEAAGLELAAQIAETTRDVRI